MLRQIQIILIYWEILIPAYHMNKEHWNTIIVDEKVDNNLVKELIEQSYQLTK